MKQINPKAAFSLIVLTTFLYMGCAMLGQTVIADMHSARGYRAYEKGNYDKAIKKFTAALDATPPTLDLAISVKRYSE